MVLTLIYLISPVQALMVKLDIEELIIGADTIVIGRVEKMRCEWSLDRETIHTVVTMQIVDTLKGNVNDRILFIQVPGGTIGELSLKVSDMPVFNENEEVLVFLRSIPNPEKRAHSMSVAQKTWPSFEVFAQAQGKFSIDSQGMAVRYGYDLVSQADDHDRILPLEELKLKIHETLVRIVKERR